MDTITIKNNEEKMYKAFLEDETYLKTIDDSKRNEFLHLQDKYVNLLCAASEKIEERLKYFDSIKNYCIDIQKTCGSLESYIDCHKLKKSDTFLKDDEANENLLFYRNELKELVGGADNYKEKYNYVVAEFIKRKNKFESDNKKSRMKFEALSPVIVKSEKYDVTFSILNGILPSITKLKKNQSSKKFVDSCYKEKVKQVNDIAVDLNKVYSELISNIAKYKSRMAQNFAWLDTMKLLINGEFKSGNDKFQAKKSFSPCLDAFESAEMQEYVSNIGFDYFDDGKKNEDDFSDKELLDIIQKNIDSFYNDIFNISDDNIVKITAKRITSDPFEDIAAPYEGDYVEFDIAVDDKFKLEDKLEIDEGSLCEHYEKIYVPLNEDFVYNFVKNVCAWFDMYGLYETISSLNRIFEKFKQKKWIDYTVIFRLNTKLNIIATHDDGTNDEPCLFENTKNFIHKLYMHEAESNLDVLGQNKEQLLNIIKADTIEAIKNHSIEFINIEKPSQVAEKVVKRVESLTQNIPVDDKSKSINKIDFDGGNILVNLSLDELFHLKNTANLLINLVNPSHVAWAIAKAINNDASKDDAKTIFAWINKKNGYQTLFNDCFNSALKGNALGVYKENFITKFLGINTNASPVELLKYLCENDDISKTVIKYQSDDIDIIKNADVSQMNQYFDNLNYGTYYFNIPVIKNDEFTSLFNEYHEASIGDAHINADNAILNREFYDFMSGIISVAEAYEKNAIFCGRCKVTSCETDDYFSIKLNDSCNISMTDIPFIYGTAKPIKSEVSKYLIKGGTEEYEEIPPEVYALGNFYLDDPCEMLSLVKLIVITAIYNRKKESERKLKSRKNKKSKTE